VNQIYNILGSRLPKEVNIEPRGVLKKLALRVTWASFRNTTVYKFAVQPSMSLSTGHYDREVQTSGDESNQKYRTSRTDAWSPKVFSTCLNWMPPSPLRTIKSPPIVRPSPTRLYSCTDLRALRIFFQAYTYPRQMRLGSRLMQLPRLFGHQDYQLSGYH
jgi:hypothetical protein